MPTLVIPATIAFSSIYPESLVSLPITTRCLWSPRMKCAPAAMPTFIAIAAVIGATLVAPRIPSVPKYFLAMSGVLKALLRRLGDWIAPKWQEGEHVGVSELPEFDRTPGARQREQAAAPAHPARADRRADRRRIARPPDRARGRRLGAAARAGLAQRA